MKSREVQCSVHASSNEGSEGGSAEKERGRLRVKNVFDSSDQSGLEEAFPSMVNRGCQVSPKVSRYGFAVLRLLSPVLFI